MLKVVVLKSLQSKLEKSGVSPLSRKWARAVRLVNDVENWYNFGSKMDGYTNSVFNKFEKACIECALKSHNMQECQTMFDAVCA